jgi:hypothetical protein
MIAFIITASTIVNGEREGGIIDVFLDHGAAIDAYNKLVDDALACDETITSERSNTGAILHETVFTLGTLTLERHTIKGPLLQSVN